VNSYLLLTALEKYLSQRGVEVDRLTADQMVRHMVDWYREVPIESLGRALSADDLLYRYGGWSEGCATGFKLSLVRRVTVPKDNSGATEWFSGITLMFEPSRYADMGSFSTVSSDWQSIDAFVRAIESSRAFRVSATTAPMAALTESGGVR
jgi:hypothetical protein